MAFAHGANDVANAIGKLIGLSLESSTPCHALRVVDRCPDASKVITQASAPCTAANIVTGSFAAALYVYNNFKVPGSNSEVGRV
jgi:phosphate/sulfate permease